MVYLLFMIRGRSEYLSASARNCTFEDAFIGIVAAMTLCLHPLLWLDTVREGITQVPNGWRIVARTLGATQSQAFRTITLPLSVRPHPLPGHFCMGQGDWGICGSHHDRLFPDGCLNPDLPGVHHRGACGEQEHRFYYAGRLLCGFPCFPADFPPVGEEP